MIESLITLIRQLHPQPWTSLEVYLAVLGAVVLVWIVIGWAADRLFLWLRRRQIRRILQTRSIYADASLPLERDRRDQAVVRPPDRGTDVSGANAIRLDGRSLSACTTSQPDGDSCTPAPATLVDPRVAGYARGTSLEAPAEDRVAEPQCTGPFSDAFDCPVHNPRRRTVAERTR